MGIGPTQPAWKASVLPLNYTRRSALRPNRARLSPNEALRVNSMLIDYSKYYLYCQLNFKIILFNFLFYNLKLMRRCADAFIWRFACLVKWLYVKLIMVN